MLQLFVIAALAASGERLHVEWVAPEGCPNRAELAASLDASVPPNRTFHASVRIDEPREEGRPWRAVVITTADRVQRTRVLDGADCARVSDAAVLVVTLAATSLPPAPERPPAIDPAPPLDPKLSASEAQTPSDPPDPFTFHVRVQPLVAANVGLLPVPGVSIGLAVALEVQRLRTQLEVASWLTSGTPRGPGVRVSLTSAKLQECFLFTPRDRLRLGPCAGLEGGRMSVEGTGVATAWQNSVWWAAVLSGVTAGFAASKSISQWVTAEVGLNLVRPQFTVETAENPRATVYGVGWVVGRITIGVEFELDIP